MAEFCEHGDEPSGFTITTIVLADTDEDLTACYEAVSHSWRFSMTQQYIHRHSTLRALLHITTLALRIIYTLCSKDYVAS
jgi:hypothetical protein